MNHLESKQLCADVIEDVSRVINMDCMNKETYSSLSVTNVIDWSVLDTKHKFAANARKTNEQIKFDISNLIDLLEEKI